MTRFIDAKTFFQTNKQCTPDLLIPTDAVVVHPHNVMPYNNVEMHDSWKGKIDSIGRMFFSDSDDLNEYTTGKWDGIDHAADIELKADGQPMKCSGIRPYMLATDGWTAYLRDRKVIPSLENGIDAILPEEPLGHAFTGYEESFKKLYEEFYDCKWAGQDSSAAAFYRTGYLKALLYNNLETELLNVTKEYGKANNRDVDFIVPIHSIFSNVANGTTAPLGLSLDTKGCDGYVGQIWTGPINWCLSNYDSPVKSFFCSAYNLYDYFVQLTVGSDKKLWLLVDPVEDDPNHSWDDFRQWYQQCATAMLFMKDVDSYEVMPWPERTFLSTSFTPGLDDFAEKKTPKDYITLILSITQVLQDIPLGGEWIENCKESQIGIAIADSLMWQKTDGPVLQGTYSLRMPLYQKGITVSNCAMERFTEKEYASRFKVLIVSFEDWKPYKKEMVDSLVNWTSNGGTLLLLGKDGDQLDQDNSFWWHQEGFTSPLKALLKQLNYQQHNNRWNFGTGHVIYDPVSPRDFAKPDIAETKYMDLINESAEKAEIEFSQKTGYFAMRRGDYVIAHAETQPFSLDGHFVDIFTPDLKIVHNIKLEKKQSGIFKDASETIAKSSTPKVLHTTFRLIYEDFSGGVLKFVVKGPAGTDISARIYKGNLKVTNISATVDNNSMDLSWTNDNHKTFKLTCPNASDGATIAIRFD